VAVDDRLGDVDELAAVVLRVVAQHLERAVAGDRVEGHQDPLRLLDLRAASERPSQAVILSEPLEGDVDRALQLFGGGIDDVGKDTPLGRLANVSGISEIECGCAKS
jgi:hypothetical protein